MNANMVRGLTRLGLLLAVLWLGGMGWYQYQQAQNTKNNSLTISLSKDSELHIDANGIKQENKDAVDPQKLVILIVPALLLALLGPVAGWLGCGFKKEGQ